MNNDVSPTYGPVDPIAESSGMPLSQVFRVLVRRWWLLLLAAGVAFGIAWYTVEEDSVVYQANAVLRFLDTPTAVPSDLASEVLENPRTSEFMTTQIHVLKSGAVIGNVVDQEGLRVDPSAGLPFSLVRVSSIASPTTRERINLEFTPEGFVARAAGTSGRARYGEEVDVGGVRFSIVRQPAVERASLDVMQRQQAIDIISARVNGLPKERSSIMDVQVIDDDPERAVAIVNAAVRAFQYHNSYMLQDQARKTREFTQDVLIQKRAELSRTMEALANFRRTTGSADMAARADAQIQTQTDLDERREEFQVRYELYSGFARRVEQATEAQIDEQLRILMTAPGAEPSPVLENLYNNFVNAITERDVLLAANRAPGAPEVVRANNLIAITRQQVVQAAKAELSSISDAVGRLQGQIARNSAIPLGNIDAETEEASLERDVELAATSLSTLTQEYERASMAEAVGLAQVEILDYAMAPIPMPQGNRSQKLLIALVLGLLLGSGGALGLETANTKIRGRFDTESLFAVPELGVIPAFGPQRLHGVRKLLKGRSVDLKPADNLQYESDYGSIAAEAYRRLRTNLVFLDTENEVKTLVITSSLPGEGKTTTAANLAVAFAREGRRVLLIDGDLRRPRLHQIFESDGAAGFIDVLLNRVNGSGPDLAHPIEGLDFLPRGEFDPRAAEMLTGSRMKALIAGFRDAYDVIIFDTAPVLLASEASVLSALADGVLLVVRAGTSKHQSVREALQQLRAVRANVVGFVLNDPEAVAVRENQYTYTKEYYPVEA